MKLSTLGASHILGDAIASATSLAAENLWTEIKPVHEKCMDNFSTFQDYLNSENGLFNYEVGTDKVTVSIVDRTSPVISNGKQLYEDQLSDLRSQTRTIEYFAEQILPKLPHFLIQKLLNNSHIQENIVPDSKIHYKVERRSSFLQIKIFFTVYAKETQGLYRFFSLPISMDSKNLYKYYKTGNVTIDQQSFLTTSKGLIDEVVCSRALTSEVPMEIDNACNKQTANLPVVSEVFPLTNTTFLLVKRGTLHCVCHNLPPITLELKFDINLLYSSKGCKIHILFPNGLSWVSAQHSTEHTVFQPIVVLQYNLEKESTKYEKLTFWHTLNSLGVLFLIILLLSATFAVYHFQKTYKMKILRGASKTAIQLFKKDKNSAVDSSANLTDGIYRRKDMKSDKRLTNSPDSLTSSDRVTVLNDDRHVRTICNEEICIMTQIQKVHFLVLYVITSRGSQLPILK